MRDDVNPVASEVAFDPANPNNAPDLNWKCDPRYYAIALRLGREIASFVNRVKPGTLDAQIVAADLVCLHCNGRPQDFDAWDRADIVTLAEQYSAVYYNFDRRTGKLPEFVRLRFDAH